MLSLPAISKDILLIYIEYYMVIFISLGLQKRPKKLILTNSMTF